MDTISLPTYFLGPQLAESSTVSACPFFFLGRNEAVYGEAMNRHLSRCPVVYESQQLEGQRPPQPRAASFSRLYRTRARGTLLRPTLRWKRACDKALT